MAVQEVVDFVQEQELISARYLNVELQFICLNCFNALHHYETEHVSRNWYNTLAGTYVCGASGVSAWISMILGPSDPFN